jgi:hypothetical protein
VAFPARPADWYCDGDCSVICRTSLCWWAGRVNNRSAGPGASSAPPSHQGRAAASPTKGESARAVLASLRSSSACRHIRMTAAIVGRPAACPHSSRSQSDRRQPHDDDGPMRHGSAHPQRCTLGLQHPAPRSGAGRYRASEVAVATNDLVATGCASDLTVRPLLLGRAGAGRSRGVGKPRTASPRTGGGRGTTVSPPRCCTRS